VQTGKGIMGERLKKPETTIGWGGGTLANVVPAFRDEFGKGKMLHGGILEENLEKTRRKRKRANGTRRREGWPFRKK